MGIPRLGCSPREAAEATGLSLSTIYNLMNDGRLPYRRAGRRRIIAVSSLRDLVGDTEAVAA